MIVKQSEINDAINKACYGFSVEMIGRRDTNRNLISSMSSTLRGLLKGLYNLSDIARKAALSLSKFKCGCVKYGINEVKIPDKLKKI